MQAEIQAVPAGKPNGPAEHFWIAIGLAVGLTLPPAVLCITRFAPGDPASSGTYLGWAWWAAALAGCGLAAFVATRVRRNLYGASQIKALFDKRTAELQASESRTAAILQSALDCIIIIDHQGKILEFNPAAERTFGHERQDVLGRDAVELMIAPQAREKQIAALKQSLLAGSGDMIGQRIETIGLRHDGIEFPIELSVTAARLNNRPVFTAMLRDITETRKLQVQLTQAHKLEAVGQLAAGIAHEINTPIQYVGDNTRFLQEAFDDLSQAIVKFEALLVTSREGQSLTQVAQEIARTLQQIDIDYLTKEIPRAVEQSLEGIERVAKIVRSMKEFAHPDGGDKTQIDLNRAIESTVTVSRNEWRYVADLETDFDPELPVVECLAGEMNQVFLNLIVNAAHAITDVVGDGSDGKGTIRVSTRRDGDWVEVRVSDTGTGIPPEIRDRIFDPFFTTKEVGRGTGQGLGIAHTVVVEKHGGTLSFETETGRGTTFIIRIPCATSDSGQRTLEYEYV